MRISLAILCLSFIFPRGAAAQDSHPFGLTLNQSLVEASFELNVEKVEELLGAGADANATFGLYIHGMFPDGYGGMSPLGSKRWTPLIAVSSSVSSRKRDPMDQSRMVLRRNQIVALLIDAGANMDADDGYGCTALHAAVERNHVQVALKLIENGAKLESSRKMGFCLSCPSGQSPLHYATRSKAVLEAMLSKGANVNVTDDQGSTPLHWAVSQQNVESVKLLVNAGANTDAVDSNGKKPIDYMHLGRSYGDLDSDNGTDATQTISALLNALP